PTQISTVLFIFIGPLPGPFRTLPSLSKMQKVPVDIESRFARQPFAVGASRRGAGSSARSGECSHEASRALIAAYHFVRPATRGPQPDCGTSVLHQEAPGP